MDLCGDLVQSLSEYLALDDLASTCDFPEELASLEQLMRAAEDLQHVRQRLAAEMADHSGMIRTLVVRAEDARLMTDMSGFDLDLRIRWWLTMALFAGGA
jgi:Bardet-Biedl syndrome 2 protein